MSEAHVRILDVDDIELLRREGTIIYDEEAGAVIIHKRRLHTSSEEEYSNVPLPSSPSVTTTDDLENFVTIPEHLISYQTLIFLGFSKAGADIIWDRWTNWGPDQGREVDGGPVTFESMARAYIRGGPMDAADDDDYAWTVAMNSCHIGQELQNAILTPKCKDVRLTASCKFWLLDTISARYASLRQIQAASRERGRAARRNASRPGPSQPPAMAPGQPMASQYRSTSEMFYGGPRMAPQTSMSKEACANAPGNTVLYHGGYETKIKTIFGDDGRVENIGNLFDGDAGDFNSSKKACYLAVDFEIANKYAYWAKKRDPSQLAIVLRLEIPNAALESLSDDIEKCFAYWPSPGWKKLVWTCRRNIRLRHELAKFGRATLIIGTICGKPDVVVTNLESPDDITHGMILQGPRGNSIQYVFIDDQGAEFLENHGTSNCKMYPMTRAVVDEIDNEDD